MLISILVSVIYYRISTSGQVLHLPVVYVISATFLSHQMFGALIVKKVLVNYISATI
jgi:hypothetical protein